MKPARPAPVISRWGRVGAEMFPGALGLWLALALIKFGNPVILDHRVLAPANLLEAIYQSWPVAWGYLLFGLVLLTGLASARVVTTSRKMPEKSHPSARILSTLCLAWLGWQFVSTFQTVDPVLSKATLPHFVVCALCFLMGSCNLARMEGLRSWDPLWLGVGGGWLVVVAIGWHQHFWGLAETREYFYSLPNWRDQAPELIAKVASDRIYSTLVYPNALAGVILLLTPGLVLGLWERCGSLPGWMRSTLSGLPVVGAVGCLAWSGSKAGWLIAVGLVGLGLILRPQPSGSGQAGGRRSMLWLSLALVVLFGLGGFWIRYSDYFARGATSLSARGDYWMVAWSNAVSRPLLGSGPGTFMAVYRAGKPAGAEMTRLVHNDYLQQATDSGFIGGLLFLGWVVGAIGVSYRRDMGWRALGLWVGVAGLALQSGVEFGLYIPALAWPWFLALGALVQRSCASGKTVDKRAAS